jgi:hypothetical protein
MFALKTFKPCCNDHQYQTSDIFVGLYGRI